MANSSNKKLVPEAMTALENYQTPEFNDHGRF